MHEAQPWHKAFDPTSRRFYYWHSVSGETVWDKPAAYCDADCDPRWQAVQTIQRAVRVFRARRAARAKLKARQERMAQYNATMSARHQAKLEAMGQLECKPSGPAGVLAMDRPLAPSLDGAGVRARASARRGKPLVRPGSGTVHVRVVAVLLCHPERRFAARHPARATTAPAWRRASLHQLYVAGRCVPRTTR